MIGSARAAVAAALLATSLQPAIAADDFREISLTNNRETRSAWFAGLNLRLGIDGNRRQQPVARLMAGQYSGSETSVRVRPVAELRFAPRSAPSLHIAGQNVNGIDQRLGLSTGAAIGIGIALGAGLLVAVAFAGADDDTFNWSQ